MLVNPNGPADVTGWKFPLDYGGSRQIPQYDNLLSLANGLVNSFYPFRPNDDAVLLSIRYVIIDTVKHPGVHSAQDSVVDGIDYGEYRFDITALLNTAIAAKPLSEYAAVNDEFGRTLPRFLTKVARNAQSQAIGYEMHVRSEYADKNLKIYFNDIIVLDLFILDWNTTRSTKPGFFSGSTGFVNQFSVSAKK